MRPFYYSFLRAPWTARILYNTDIVKIFDTHAHLGLVKEDKISQLIVAQEALSRGVAGIVNVCNNLQDFPVVYQNLHNASNVYFAVGISPSEVANTHFAWDTKVEELSLLDKVIAIGETGLDRKFGNKDLQIEFFIRHMEIAEKRKLPLIIHNREAGKEVCEVLSERSLSIPIILHCYSEDWEYAQKILAITKNVYFSFTGSVTYKTARKLREAAANIPIEHIIVESESPFMPPAESKEKRNKPSLIRHTVAHLAQIREMEEEAMAEALLKNSCTLFNVAL